ncbi:hypothetical protein BGZ80_008549 [Entomortierella chlamydospora]|uniref:Uncharacterized protein n=1 Tax=Entomortierella chlamydospora TaxID=101097 RepID=A0A9P6MXA5_9FUNG|nr:hypothetical protein BGZ79_004748 [Entomortierella chlamydospora]KAG0017172.1 hypothetical protein BGZ80_008549 [Entomortierella chlamydospora]
MDNQFTNPLGDRGRAAEEIYIRQREAEKAAAAAAAKEKAKQEAEKAAGKN